MGLSLKWADSLPHIGQQDQEAFFDSAGSHLYLPPYLEKLKWQKNECATSKADVQPVENAKQDSWFRGFFRRNTSAFLLLFSGGSEDNC